MKTFHIEYTLFGNPEHEEVDWEADTAEEAVKELIQNEVDWGKVLGCPVPRDAVRIFKIDGIEVADIAEFNDDE